VPDLTLGAALVAGILSFISPCVLPVVPAYLGQLGAIAVAGTRSPGGSPAAASGPSALVGPGTLAVADGPSVSAATMTAARRRWLVLPHALAFVLGFTAIFTALGLTVYVGRALQIDLPLLRVLGGAVLVVLGLNLMGVIRVPLLMRSWRPFDTFGSQRPAAANPLGAFGLGAIFAIGWTPCIGPTLGAILGLSALAPSAQVVALFVAYSIGLGVPFVALALALDRAPAMIRPLVRYGREVEIVGGALVVVIGLAIIFDWLGFFARTFSFLWPQV
jgi:cytochrome c-type biogenesis protein